MKLAEIAETSYHTEAGFWCCNPTVRDYFEDPGVDGRIILRWIFSKWDGGAWTGLIWLRIGTGGGSFKRCDEPSDSIKCGEFLD